MEKSTKKYKEKVQKREKKGKKQKCMHALVSFEYFTYSSGRCSNAVKKKRIFNADFPATQTRLKI